MSWKWSSWIFEKSGSFLLINKFLLFQYSEGIYSVSARAVGLRVAQNSHVLFPYLRGAKLSIKSQGTLGKKRMNIQTIENG